MKVVFRFLMLIMCLGTTSLVSQTFEKAKPYYILKFDLGEKSKDFERAVIKSPFAKDKLSKKPLPRNFSKGKIVAIDYYYTQFKSVKPWQQVNLDAARFKNLQLQHPEIYAQIDSVPLRFIEQTLAQTVREAKFFFHGFVIYYQVIKRGRNARRSDVNRINALFKNGFKLDDSPEYGQVRQIKGTQQRDYLNVWGKDIHLSEPDTVIIVDRNNVTGEVRKIAKNEFVTCYKEGNVVGDNKVEVKLFKVPKEYYPGTSPPPFRAGMFGLMEKSKKESRLRALSSQKNKKTNSRSVTAVSYNLYETLQKYPHDSVVVVIDVTGSMVGSIAHVLKWIHQDSMKGKVKGVVLFNDGDGKKDKNKVIGETGGLYFTDGITKLQKTLVRAIKNGSGGTLPENDLEAVLAAKERYGEGHYILVADNNAHPRDLPLLEQIDFPVDVLVCNGLAIKYYYQSIISKTGGIIVNANSVISEP